MSIPGVGVVTATAFATVVENPANFRRLRYVGARHGLTTRRYPARQVDYNGHISGRGDHQVRYFLYEAACVILTRSSAESTLRDWGLKLRERVGFKRAAVAVARKLSVVMHAMLKLRLRLRRTGSTSPSAHHRSNSAGRQPANEPVPAGTWAEPSRLIGCNGICRVRRPHRKVSSAEHPTGRQPMPTAQTTLNSTFGQLKTYLQRRWRLDDPISFRDGVLRSEQQQLD